VVGEVHEQVAGLLGDPGPGRVGVDPGDVYAAAPMFDHDEDVEAAEEDGVDVGEVDREIARAWAAMSCRQGGLGPSWGGTNTCGLQDCPHGRRGNRMAEATSSP
jgi:hypothetical protein